MCIRDSSVTAPSGYDANTGEQIKNQDERELPSTVTLLVTPEQGNILAELEAEGKSHLSLVFRGDSDKAKGFITVQEDVINKLHHPEITANEVEATPESEKIEQPKNPDTEERDGE